jgi:predicted metal-dependent hydrolase
VVVVDPPDTKHETPNAKYERGIELFNRGEYFDAHEVWEELWMECQAAERRFFQALIQAAVALHHFERGNHTGAARLFRSGRDYMAPFRPAHRGLDVDAFWRQMEACLAPALVPGEGSSCYRPIIALHPEGEARDD